MMKEIGDVMRGNMVRWVMFAKMGGWEMTKRTYFGGVFKPTFLKMNVKGKREKGKVSV
jgi:hypothetical protein